MGIDLQLDMVEMSSSSLLAGQKPIYSKALQDNKTAIFSMKKDSSKFVNGDVGYFSKERSYSDSSDSHELDNLLQAADKIKETKNGFQKLKKHVHFNMENNQEFSYSYAAHDDSSDDEKFANVNFNGYGYMNGEAESDEEEDDDYEEESDDNEYDTETSEEGSCTSLGKYGYLVDKSSDREQNGSNDNNMNNNNTLSELKYEEKAAKVEYRNGVDKKAELDAETQLEKMIKSRKDAVEGEINDLTSQLVEFREKTQTEMNRLQNELEARRKEYSIEIDEITRQRQEQKQKFEEELEEFQNEEKLEERRQNYHEHEKIITEQEDNLARRKAQVVEQEREIKEYEEYLNRRHVICNGKEEDLNVLQNELDTLSRELEVNKERLLNKQLSYKKQLEDLDDSQSESSPVNDKLLRRASRVNACRGTEIRLEELKQQNKQVLEELFALKKALESKGEELETSHKTIDEITTENKRLTQKVKNLETQLELSRKTNEFYGSDLQQASVEDILRRNATELRKSRVSRMASRVHLEPLSLSPSPLSRTNSVDSESSKLAKSSSSSDSNGKSSLRRRQSSGSDDKPRKHAVKTGTEKTTSSLCLVM